MALRPYRRRNGHPSRRELLHQIDRAERAIRRMASRWSDSIPAAVRAELHEIATPLLRLLMRAKRR